MLNMRLKNISLILLFFVMAAASSLNGQNVKKLSNIPIRDPYIMPDEKRGYYYMYKSASVNRDGQTLGGVETYRSKDLKNWEGPVQVFTVPDDNWITGAVWAPEVHPYNGKYYLFATLNSNIEWKKEQKGWPKYFFRGTQIFVADRPEGPFLAFEKTPHTPMDQMALDGTLWVEDGRPYMIYCHEWVQVIDGTMVLVELAPDLSAPIGDRLTLFHASAADCALPSIALTHRGARNEPGSSSWKTKGIRWYCFRSYHFSGYEIEKRHLDMYHLPAQHYSLEIV